MKLFRRKLLKQITILGLGLIALPKKRATAALLGHDSSGLKEINITKSFKTFQLPSFPATNTKIYFHVSRSSLRFPSKVSSDKHKILGKNDQLILDSLGNFSLTFIDNKTGWILT